MLTNYIMADQSARFSIHLLDFDPLSKPKSVPDVAIPTNAFDSETLTDHDRMSRGCIQSRRRAAASVNMPGVEAAPIVYTTTTRLAGTSVTAVLLLASHSLKCSPRVL